MKWWPFGRKPACPTEDAIAADVEAARALRDAEALHVRADKVADRLAIRSERNGFADAVYQVMREVT
jgi:hypothetical protein